MVDVFEKAMRVYEEALKALREVEASFKERARALARYDPELVGRVLEYILRRREARLMEVVEDLKLDRVKAFEAASLLGDLKHLGLIDMDGEVMRVQEPQA